MNKIKYKELKNYKYELVENYEIETGLELACLDIFEPGSEYPYISLTAKGKLTVYEGYAWDGASGIAVDTQNFMRGSLVHDAFYQLMRQGKLDLKHRDFADRLLQKICKEDGMNSFRAGNVYYAVKLFGESSARPTNETETQEKVLEAPQ